MPLHRFFVDEAISGDTLAVSKKELLHQWQNVFRFKEGDTLVLFDGRGSEYSARLRKLGKEEAFLSIDEKLEGKKPKITLWLFSAILKRDKFERIIEKTTKLGVSHIVPILTERGEKKGPNELRLRTIIIEASEQSGRTVLPMLHGTFTLTEAIEKHRFPLIAFDPAGETFSHRHLASETIGIFIGPEGGWSETERALFTERKIPIVALATPTLRSEMAAVAATALVLLS